MAKLIRPPTGFDNLDQFNTYIRCVKKLKTGDEVEIYLTLASDRGACTPKNWELRYVPMSIPSAYFERVKIIGRDTTVPNRKNTFLLGTNHNLGFWSRTPSGIPLGIMELSKDCSKYKYGYWANFENLPIEIRLRKIYRADDLDPNISG